MPFAPESFPDMPDPSAIPDGLTNIVGDVGSWTDQFFAKPIGMVEASGGFITGIPGDVAGWLWKASGIPTVVKYVEAFAVRVSNSLMNTFFFGTCSLVGFAMMVWGILLITGETKTLTAALKTAAVAGAAA